MSAEEDMTDHIVAYVDTQIHGCEKFVTDNLAKVQENNESLISSACKSQEGLMKKLEEKTNKRIEALEKQNKDQQTLIEMLQEKVNQFKECQCKELHEAYMAAGKLVFSERKFVVLENEEGPSYAGIVDRDTTETDIANRTSQRSPHVVDQVIVPAPVFQTQEVITPYKSLEELPKGLKDELMKYTKPNQSSASADKLSDLQRQYFVYYMKAKDSKSDTPAVAARKLYDAGLKDRMWNINFSPPGCPDFVKYLTQKVKNFRFQRRLKAEADKQSERLNGSLESSMKRQKLM